MVYIILFISGKVLRVMNKENKKVKMGDWVE